MIRLPRGSAGAHDIPIFAPSVFAPSVCANAHSGWSPKTQLVGFPWSGARSDRGTSRRNGSLHDLTGVPASLGGVREHAFAAVWAGISLPTRFKCYT